MTWSSVFFRFAVLPFSLFIVCVSTEAIAVPGIEDAPTEDVSRYEPVFQKDYEKNYAERLSKPHGYS